jgi:undecaprenyl-diphosphatase
MSTHPEAAADSPDAAATAAAAALERALAEVTTDAQAENLLRDLHGLLGARTIAEETGSDELPVPGQATHGLAEAITRASQAAPEGQQAAAIFTAVASQLAALPPAEADALDESILRVTNPVSAGVAPGPLRTSRRRLRRAVIKGLGPLYAVDTAVFLDINQLPHPAWMNAAMRFVTITMKAANAVTCGLFVAAVCAPQRGARVLAETLPPLWLTTFVMEVPVKRFFRRRRPFIEVIRATVVGRRPSSFSFPSGHSAAAFAAAALLRRQYPRLGWMFYGLALLVGFSRIYLGAHYPADVLTGAVGGTVLSETAGALWRRPARGVAALILPVLRLMRWLVR